ncbi:1565_t:CDS:2, partial [Acaulospora colombiana]
EYMQDIIDTFRAAGLNKIPTTHNDKHAYGEFAAPGLGQVDLYGWDGYPAGFDCITPSVWPELDTCRCCYLNEAIDMLNQISTLCKSHEARTSSAYGFI